LAEGPGNGLVGYPDERLRTVCRPVEEGEADLPQLAERMRDLMRKHDGVGLAAPQVGDRRRVVVVEAPGYRKGRGRLTLVNPQLRRLSGSPTPFREGCLSFPGIYRDISRPRAAVVDYLDLHGEPRRLEDDGLLARIVLHELDHLDGVLMIDHLPLWSRVEVGVRLRLRGMARTFGAGGET